MRPSWSWLAVALLTFAAASALAAEPAKPAPPTEDITVIGKRAVASDTSYWTEDAYAAYPLLGPNFAQGLVIWNHPESFDGSGAELPPIRVMEGLASLGWDITRLQRNSRLKPGWDNKMADVRAALAKALAAAKVEGYRRIILAGQQVGGGLALESGKEVDGIYAIIAFAPNTGIFWYGAPRYPSPIPTDWEAGSILSRTWDQLEHTHAERLLVLFPERDQEVPHERGPTARDILTKRGDLPFLLIDETSGVRTTEGADTPDFNAYASCMDLFLSPDLAPRPGEFHCGTDEVPTALAQMGVRPRGGESWFGYSSRGQTIYLELPADGRGLLTYGWGAGARGKIRPGFKTLPATFAGDTVTAELAPPDQMLRGVRHGALFRLTVDLEDGTRDAVTLHRLAGNS
jgi:dienelactone hydrolase